MQTILIFWAETDVQKKIKKRTGIIVLLVIFNISSLLFFRSYFTALVSSSQLSVLKGATGKSALLKRLPIAALLN